MPDIEAIIGEKRNSLKTDRLDMSFGELINMYEDEDLFITPEYQRAFRWQPDQQTRFIESVLLGIPIPPIFVAEDATSKWEVVDGLQRISTIFSFFGLLRSFSDKNNLVLTEGELVKELVGLTHETIPIKLKTTLKRSVCRVEVVRWDSLEDIRYELFNRLNTGASPLSEQEIRNCIFRAYPIDLNAVLRAIAKLPEFNQLISPSESRKEEMFLEELVLRFFAFRHLLADIKSPIPKFLTEFMKSVSKGDQAFDIDSERDYLIKVIHLLNGKYGRGLFRPNGSFALHIFDSISYALPKYFETIEGNEEKIFNKIDQLLVDENYASIGTSTFSNSRIRARMARAQEIFGGT